MRLLPADHPRRQVLKPLGRANDGTGEIIGLSVPDARHHLHVAGVTGTGKSTWLAHATLAEARAGRGVALIDCQGDLARNVLDRLPASAAHRLVILDPAETQAPPAWNVLAASGVQGRQWAAENVVAVFRRLYSQWWGPRMDDLLRAACLTLVRHSGSTIADVIPLLTSHAYRSRLLAEHGRPPGLEGFWEGFEELSVGQRGQLCAPVLSRLRPVFTRPFARDLLGAPTSTFDLADILDGGILIARLAKGEIGEDTARLVGSLLLSGLWATATRRSAVPPDQRCDATVIVDECHNVLHLPIGVEDALAEARGYRLSLVLAHQNLDQLPPDVRSAIDANARNKIYFTVSPTDAGKLVRHVAPFFTEHDLSHRPGFAVTARVVNQGHDQPAFSLDALPLLPAQPGRAEALRAAARERTGLTRQAREQARKQRGYLASVSTDSLLVDQPGQSVRHSDRHPSRQRDRNLGRRTDWRTRSPLYPQVNPAEEAS